MRYFEDFRIGEFLGGGPYVVTREEIAEFALKFDPQPFHLSEEFGKKIPHFGGIVASGWHTASIAHRLFHDGVLVGTAAVGSPGLDDLRWLKPVKPGDALSLRAEVVEVNPSKSHPERGTVRWLIELRNQRGEVVISYRPVGMLMRQPQPSREQGPELAPRSEQANATPAL
jgi:acyl dehydratase